MEIGENTQPEMIDNSASSIASNPLLYSIVILNLFSSVRCLLDHGAKMEENEHGMTPLKVKASFKRFP